MTKIKCPKCKSINCTPLANKKGFSVGKAALGTAVGAVIHPAGAAIGLLTGFNGKKKVSMMCNDCGTLFEIKV